jgi:uncharacterized protein (TIGR03000 family)
MRRRTLLVVLAGLAVVVTAGAWLLWPRQDRITPENLDRIELPYGYAYMNGTLQPSSQQYVSGYYAPDGAPLPTWSNVNQGLNRPTTERSMPPGAVTSEIPGRLVVSLPPEARLTIEGQATQSRSGERVFVSPPLQRGKTYTYNLKVEVDRNGERAVKWGGAATPPRVARGLGKTHREG